MIYLVDEKRQRQSSYSWDREKLDGHKSLIKPVYSKTELDSVNKEIFSDTGNVLLFHDSFFDDPQNRHYKDIDLIRQDLIERSNDITTVFFSGGVYNRVLHSEKRASLPVEWVYKHLDFFVEQYSKGDVDLKYLAFGRNYQYEPVSLLRASIWEILYKRQPNEPLPLSKDPQKNNSTLDAHVRDLAKAVGKSDELDSWPLETMEVDYFKYKINTWVKEFING